MNDFSKSNFEAVILDEVPDELSSDLHYFWWLQHPNNEPFRNPDRGLKVKVQPKGMRPWVGIFECGSYQQTGLYISADPNELFVITKGAGYHVNCKNPGMWGEVNCLPVLGVFSIEEQSLLIFNDFTDICAWGKDGLAWRTDRLVSDDLIIETADRHYLKGRATDCGKQVRFTVDTATGKTLSLERVEDA